MLNYLVWIGLATALAGTAVGATGHKLWLADKARKKRSIPAQWNLQARSLLSPTEVEVWQWLQRAFFEYDVLVKVALIRFMSPHSKAEGERSHELIKGLYCTFTICAVDGTVIGCMDVPGRQGLKATARDLKQTLFAECGLAYAVVRSTNLPSLEAVRSAFLGEVDLSADEAAAPPVAVAVLEEPEFLIEPTEPTPLPVSLTTSAETSVHVDMLAVAQVRNSLRAKLDRNRKIRFTNFDPLSNGSGIDHDGSSPQVTAAWEDSFIMSEGHDKAGAPRS
jgi:hypothetical protein